MRKNTSFLVSLGFLAQPLFLILCILIPGLILGWQLDSYSTHWVSIGVIGLTYLLSNLTLNRLLILPGYQTKFYIIPTIAVWFACLLIVVMFFRLPYSGRYVTIGIILIIFFIFFDFIKNKNKVKRIGYIYLDDTYNLKTVPHIDYILITKPELPEQAIDYIIVNLGSNNITSEWEKFISNCSLQGIIVLNARQVLESYTGRVKLDHLSENDLGSLQPSYLYLKIKRLIDITSTLLLLPFLLPIICITLIIIKLESHGPAIFTQKRVGQYGKEFKIYKFRSMYLDSEKHGAQFASHQDHRVTPFGKIIRKLRIDELPQFLNIFKGDMSLIGPRPEQKTFVEQFEQEIPFYNYRHIVKPGISGWAQVNQGYTANITETFIKTEYDFFYIKHFSFSLDFFIFMKTIKTIFTGFGAR